MKFSCQDGYDLWIRFTAKYQVANINEPYSITDNTIVT